MTGPTLVATTPRRLSRPELHLAAFTVAFLTIVLVVSGYHLVCAVGLCAKMEYSETREVAVLVGALAWTAVAWVLGVFVGWVRKGR